MPRVVIAGLRGGSGKTTLSLGLLRLWNNKGRRIIPFKKGPDYIDAAWLSAAAKTQCYNLDSYIIPEQMLLSSLLNHSKDSTKDSGGVLIEGNRGLFDGVDAKGTFSTAALAGLCASPVVLIVDCVKAAATVGVIVKGIVEFSKELMIKGVVLNYISNERHEKVIREAVESYAGVPVVGVLKRSDTPFQQERHMGLMSRDETSEIETVLERMAAAVGASVDEEKIWQIAAGAPPLDYAASEPAASSSDESGAAVRIGVIKDSAFQFYYPENIEALKALGAEVVEISALVTDMPDDLDALYIGGGFPETHALSLSENTHFTRKLKKLIECGLPVYAECGGLMYLGRGIVCNERYYSMTGVFPIDFVMHEKPQAHGYTIVEAVEENPYFPKNVILRGHEFHYSKAVNLDMERLNFMFKMKRGKGIVDGRDGLSYKRVFATYTHVHALGCTQWAPGLVRAAAAYKNSR
ncbi:MAG: cobyrinate a,c-diamide synthase [Nitrospirota bacterium]